MALDVAFAPYRLAAGPLAEESARVAEALAADPPLAPATEPLPAPLVNRALADLPAGRAATLAEACRGGDGNPAGLADAPRACLVGDAQRSRVAEAARAALEAGFAGVCLDRPDAALALGLLGAGFCAPCQAAFGAQLVRIYGDHFEPLDYARLAREAVTQAAGAVDADALPFGRDFWRWRNEALELALRAYVRGVRDAARARERPFEVVAQFEAMGPAQLRAARLLDAAIFPGSQAAGVGIGHARLLRAVMGRRPAAVAAPSGPAPTPASALVRLAAVGATCGVDISGLEPSGAAGLQVAAIRRLARQLAVQAARPAALARPVAEACLLYSTEADLWTGGRHRLAVERAGEALAALHVQAPVVLRVSDVPAGAALVLADASALTAHEGKEVRRRLEGGTAVLAFGEPGTVDEQGHPAGPLLPGSKAGGVKVGDGTVAALPPLAPERGNAVPLPPATLEKTLDALLGRGRRAAGLAGRHPVLVVLQRTGQAVDVHLVALGVDRAQGVTLFLGEHVAGGVRRGRFISSDGTDVRIPMNPSGYSISTVLPSFKGYAVLSLAT